MSNNMCNDKYTAMFSVHYVEVVFSDYDPIKYKHKYVQLSKVSRSLPLIVLLNSILKVEIQLSGKL